MISTGSTSNGVLQYSENDQTKVFKQVIAFDLLRAVISIKTFLVLIDIFECSELMIGGTDKIRPWPSKTRG
jgi:hypothetical protein